MEPVSHDAFRQIKHPKDMLSKYLVKLVTAEYDEVCQRQYSLILIPQSIGLVKNQCKRIIEIQNQH
jgi:hypothetical protein